MLFLLTGAPSTDGRPTFWHTNTRVTRSSQAQKMFTEPDYFVMRAKARGRPVGIGSHLPPRGFQRLHSDGQAWQQAPAEPPHQPLKHYAPSFLHLLIYSLKFSENTPY